MTLDDILDKEVTRLQTYLEAGRLSFLGSLARSKAALLVIALLVIVFQMRNLPQTLASSSLDAAISIQSPAAPATVRLVTIDDQDYATLFNAHSPLDPGVFGQLLSAIAAGQPRAIVVDIDTSDSSFGTMSVPSIPIVWNVSGDQKSDGKFTLDKPLGGRPLAREWVTALAVMPRDDRGIVRGYQEAYPVEGGGVVSSPGHAATLLAGMAKQPNTVGGLAIEYLDFRYQFSPIKARDLLADAGASSWSSIGAFRNQIVVIGGAYRVARDQYATPKGIMDGCQIVAEATESEIDGTLIRPASRWMTGLMMILAGLAILAVYHWLALRVAFVVSLVMVPLLSIMANWILFHRLAAWGALVPLVVAVIVVELYSKAAIYLTFYERLKAVKKVDAAEIETNRTTVQQ